MFTDVAANGGDQGRHAVEGPPAQALAGDLGEEALDEIQPGSASRGEVEMKARVRGEPCLHRRMLVGAVVIENEMDILAPRGLPIDSVQEYQELGVARLTALDDVAFENIQGRK